MVPGADPPNYCAVSIIRAVTDLRLHGTRRIDHAKTMLVSALATNFPNSLFLMMLFLCLVLSSCPAVVFSFSLLHCQYFLRHARTFFLSITHTLTLVVIFFALCLLLLTLSIAGVACTCRACHSSGTFFHCDTHTHTHTFRFSHLCVVFFLSSQWKLLLIFLFPGLPHLFSYLVVHISRFNLLFSYEYFAILEQVSRFLSPISSSRLSPGSSSHKANIFLSDYEF